MTTKTPAATIIQAGSLSIDLSKIITVGAPAAKNCSHDNPPTKGPFQHHPAVSGGTLLYFRM